MSTAVTMTTVTTSHPDLRDRAKLPTATRIESVCTNHSENRSVFARTDTDHREVTVYQVKNPKYLSFYYF